MGEEFKLHMSKVKIFHMKSDTEPYKRDKPIADARMTFSIHWSQ